jgi:hypothetical protein
MKKFSWRLSPTTREIGRRVKGPLLYARVDGVEVKGELILMELIDPALFLGHAPVAASRFADAIVRLARRKSL